jgi:hypothetical protein
MSITTTLRDDLESPQAFTEMDELTFDQAFVDLGDLDLTIDEEIFLSPGEGDTVPQVEMWTTFGTTCFSCTCPAESCGGCTQVCGSACAC